MNKIIAISILDLVVAGAFGGAVFHTTKNYTFALLTAYLLIRQAHIFVAITEIHHREAAR